MAENRSRLHKTYPKKAIFMTLYAALENLFVSLDPSGGISALLIDP